MSDRVSHGTVVDWRVKIKSKEDRALKFASVLEELYGTHVYNHHNDNHSIKPNEHCKDYLDCYHLFLLFRLVRQ